MKGVVFVLIFFAVSFTALNAQQGHHMSQKAHEKINELEKIKLMEALNLDEATMVKFFARRKDFQNRIAGLNLQKNNELDELQNALNSEGGAVRDEQFYKKFVENIKSLDMNIAKTRNEYFSSLRDILSQRQIAKLMVFERNFRKELRDIIFKERRRNLE
ncbi:MAG: hypothetical protein ACM3UR_15915 [Bacteroidota bacterium]|jgi:hypothetical protein|nr:hypothetical protein [Ignavibacteria bacterium]MCU7500402.1 hypothetical protein [Ignavibacteria bacterium]MCU7512750.1 hypothetical protein [Ignavibacteria bacterium]MCU7520368.1 hypothetical protein [Ignavibacteria bacterium]MCU7523971.1 hypothetical protein [Ignavibacteria bacterium]